jgi:hypothetical protein
VPAATVDAATAAAAAAAAAVTTSISNLSAPMMTTQQDVAPRGGRLVLFDSAEILHEVLPSHNKGGQRVALTVWVSDRRDR